MQVVAESIRLFSERGYEATPVDDVAAAAGVSRRTLFRQFRSKEDLIFADHESLLEQVSGLLAAHEQTETDPLLAVCEAAEQVFNHYATIRDLATRRYQVVSQVPALRDRELVTTYRYQRLFEDFLRRTASHIPRVRIVAFAAAVTGAHNYFLRSMMRGEDVTSDGLTAELSALRTVAAGYVNSDPGPQQDVLVVSFPAGTSVDVVADAVRSRLTRH